LPSRILQTKTLRVRINSVNYQHYLCVLEQISRGYVHMVCIVIDYRTVSTSVEYFFPNLFRLSLILRVAGLNLFLVNCYFMEVRRLSFGGSFHDQIKIRLGKARLVILKKETEGYM